MSLIKEFVQQERSHTHIPTHKKGVGNVTSKNDQNEKYAATYHIGNTVIHVVAPPPMTAEEKQTKVNEFYKAAWEVVKELNRNNMVDA
ncbi:hypothetical protein QNH20_19365 [Neobacillus sp. WH10]|uniref:hypothetical protein n=1 Tax=Neobacillus sp. WH10 TaxID=3047873 RepID=UPI0024C102FF|nr:hypothetical protein [Neobacillus sp. WH10]WHY76264.1 hypothetical protein QNH20_19365 [Neobacillus sp. WH10]